MPPAVAHRRSRALAALVSLAGLYSFSFSFPFGTNVVAGMLGLVLSVLAMREQGTVSWPLGLGALASVGAAVSSVWPAGAGDGWEFAGAYVWFGCSAVMLGSGIVAVFRSLLEEPWRADGPSAAGRPGAPT